MQILKNRFATLAPRMNMIYVKLHAQSDCRTSATSTAFEIVPLEHTPAEAERWIAPCCVLAVNVGYNLMFRMLCAGSVGIIDESSQCIHP